MSLWRTSEVCTYRKFVTYLQHIQQSLQETPATGRRHNGTYSTAKTWQVAWPSEEP